MTALLSATTAKALGSPVETSLGELLAEYGFGQDSALLGSLRELQVCFDHYGISCTPPVGQGGLEDARVLVNTAAGSLDAALGEIGELETATVEFKSSLQVDRRRLEKDPGRPLPDYRSDEVLRSALKTVAAFANSGGGTVYFGVEDNGNVCGLKEDFAAVSPTNPCYDGWDLHFRNLLRSRLSDGAAMSAYVRTSCYSYLERTFVQVRVAPRSRLTFVKTGEIWELFIRSGTQTNSVPYCDVEQHFSLTRLY